MKSITQSEILRWIFNLAFCLFVFAPQIAFGNVSPKALVIPLKGEVNPIVISFIKDEVKKAEKNKASFILLKLNIEGEFKPALKHLVKTIRLSKVPVISYVPAETTTASLPEVFLLAASHVSVMAPGTRLGTGQSQEDFEIPLPDDLAKEQEKSRKEQIALFKALTSPQGKNNQWIEDMILNNESWTADEAKKLGAIDLVAENLDTLLEKLQDRKIRLSSGIVALNTKNISLTQPDSPEILEAMETLSNPEISKWIILAGIVLLFLDFLVFGAVVPGAIGMIAVVLVLFSLGLISPLTAGWTFILMGVMLLITEGILMAMGLIALCGTVSLIFGILVLLGHYFPDLLISDTTPLLAISAGVLFSVFLFLILRKLVARFSMKKDRKIPA